MIRYFFDALRITNNNIILATPLILFMLIVSQIAGITSTSQKLSMLQVFIVSQLDFLRGSFLF